jgi:hypothetical protein
MNIGLTIPFYNETHNIRRVITKKLFKHYMQIKKDLLQYDINLKIAFIGSEGLDSSSFCEEFLIDGNIYLEFNQNYQGFALRDKFNAGLQSLGEQEFYCICGSNDFVSSDIFKSLKNSFEVDLIGVRADYFENNLIVIDYQRRIGFKGSGIYPPIDGFQLARNNRMVGGFFGISNKFFNAMDKKPFFNEWDEVGLESHCASNGNLRSFVSTKILNIKTDFDITKFEDVKFHHYNGDLTQEEMNSYLKYLDEL